MPTQSTSPRLPEGQKEKEKEALQEARDNEQVVTTNEGLLIRVEKKNIKDATVGL